MATSFLTHLQKTKNTLFTAPASTSPQLRQAAEAYAAELSGAENTAVEVPDNLETYLKKVALYAYKTTDDDVQRLDEAGYSEDEIFELTLCAALGAGMVRLERGLAALKGE